MIEGVVNAAYEAAVPLPVRGPSGQSREIEAVVDTGFNSFLTLPPTLVDEFRLTITGRGRAILANGSEEFFDICGITVLWEDQPRYVDAYVSDTTPLVGMSLLDTHSLYVEVADGGRVVIQSME